MIGHDGEGGTKGRSTRRTAMLVLGLLVAACASSTGTGTPSVTSGATTAVPSSSPGPSDVPTETAGPPRAASFDPSAVGLAVDVVADGLDHPVDAASAGDGSGRLYVVEQPGRIRLVDDGGLAADPFLDIRDRVTSGGERGLLGLAFHPDYPDDPRFFVDYTDRAGNTVVAEYRTSAAGAPSVDPASERILLEVDQPYPNHNGGGVVFGPDGMLYVAMGDGGSGGDPHGNGQRLDTLLAKILRIDVDGRPDTADAEYRIPADNPFVGVADAMPEIWLTGLRNPWRIRFDEATGDLWIGDVGQSEWEEIDVAPAGSGGLNFGWNRMEGFHCFEPSEGCDETGLTLPVAEYGHDLGCAVIGGVVVRDPAQPLLDGGYLFSDSCSGNLWLIDAAVRDRQEPVLVRRSGGSVSAIVLDEDGTVLATDLGTGQLLALTAMPR